MGQLDSEVLRWSLRALLCSRAEEWRRFDELFDAYFLSTPNRRKLVAYARRRRGADRAEIARTGNATHSEGMPLSLAGRNDDQPTTAGRRSGAGRIR